MMMMMMMMMMTTMMTMMTTMMLKTMVTMKESKMTSSRCIMMKEHTIAETLFKWKKMKKRYTIGRFRRSLGHVKEHLGWFVSSRDRQGDL